MSSEIQTTTKTYRKKHGDEQTSSKKRKREDKASADSTTTTPTTSKRRRHDEDTTVSETINPAEEDHTQDITSDASASDSSPFHTQTTSFYLALSPIGQAKPLESLCAEHLSPLLLTYYPPFNGVVLCYQNARMSNGPSTTDESGTEVLARSVDEYAVSYVWLTADFTVLKPTKGVWIEGHVSVQSETHLGLVCWNLFNASIDSKRLPRKWRWVGGTTKARKKQSDEDGNTVIVDDGEGHFLDADGEKVDGVVKFRVRDFENLADFSKDKGFMSIEGTLLTEEEEETAERDEPRSSRGGRGRSGRHTGRPREKTVEVS